MNRIIYYLTVGCLACNFLFAGTDGTLRGKITDEDGSALVGTQIFIPEISKGTTADIDGNFILLNISVGTYEVQIRMIGYQTKILDNVSIIMDQTKWLNVSLPVASIEGEIVYVSTEKALVEKGSTSKKITMSKEAIETLPIRDVSQLYDLQSGVVKVESGTQGIPDHEDRGLEEVHVRGGRSGEIAYMIDGMYIRNPIYGGIGNGTRLNKFAIREFDWQPGGFNAEYGDAMSAVSNFHTMSGTNSFQYKFQYETSLLGEALGSRYDELRNYHDYNFGIGGPIPFTKKKIKLWISAQKTDKGAYRVLKFDNTTYQPDRDVISGRPYKYFDLNDLYNIREDHPNWDNMKYDFTWPFDDIVGYKGFGFDYTTDYFTKLTYEITPQHKLTLSYWNVDAHRKGFKIYSGADDHPAGYAPYLYWDDGQNEIFRNTQRTAFEFNHTVNNSSFYTVRLSDFIQDQFIGVRWKDSDNDGFPDWYEWSHKAGLSDYSDPYNPDMIPFHLSNNGDIVYYDRRDGEGPRDWTSGWHYGAPVPGNYNWRATEFYDDQNDNGIFDEGDIFSLEDDISVVDGQWTGPELVELCEYRDGDYWLTPDMYVDPETFWDSRGAYLYNEGLNPWMTTTEVGQFYYTTSGADSSDTYHLWRKLYFTEWTEENNFGGSDRFYSASTARTQEIRFDYTNQITNKWKARIGFDYKTHKLNFNEIKEPWNDESAMRQRFAEQFKDYGVDGYEWIDPLGPGVKDVGEGNGVWDNEGVYRNPITGVDEWYGGEAYDDFNGDGEWNDYVEPEEFSIYFQNTFEVPWMVINAGLRLDAVQYNSKVWATPQGDFSPYSPHFYFDCGVDLNPYTNEVMCQNDYYYVTTDYYNFSTSDPEDFIEIKINDNEYYNEDWDGADEDDAILVDQMSVLMNSNNVWDQGEPTTSSINETNNYSKVIFKPSEWLYKISPRIGISHVISDGATFTFNYGLYYQTPIYEFVYRNINKLEDPSQAFEDAGKEGSSIGNATMTAGRTQAYELAFNMQFTRKWAFSAGIWVKDMDQLTTANDFNSGIYEYKVAKNGDFGTAVGFDFTLENTGSLFSTTMQYTYSTAKASSAYDAEAFGAIKVDAPQQEYLMPYDRTHDLTLSLYTKKLPWGINAGITAFFQSGQPYTPVLVEGNKTRIDYKNKYSKRSPALKTMNLSLSKDINIRRHTLSFGANIFNLFDQPYPIDVYSISGSPDHPGEFYDRKIGKIDGISGSFYDRPWMYSNNREINFFIRINFE